MNEADSILRELKDLVIFGVALIGAGLGLLNYWRSIARDRVSLRVKPHGYITSTGDSGIAIEVLNLSAFAVTVSQVGFDMEDGKIFLMIPYAALGGKAPPQRLEPRSSFTTHFMPGKEKLEGFASITRAFGKTACEERFTGTSPFLKGCIKDARSVKLNKK